jgi:hypothetical protein
MAKLTVVFGVVLTAVGVWGYIATGSVHPTALIPAWFGLVLVVAGVGAHTENAKRRMLWMHFAVTIGLLGFLGTAAAVVDEVRMLRGVSFAHPIAVQEKAEMSLICLAFVLLCVRSFIAARKARKTEL